jgi:hypothetical protein
MGGDRGEGLKESPLVSGTGGDSRGATLVRLPARLAPGTKNPVVIATGFEASLTLLGTLGFGPINTLAL